MEKKKTGSLKFQSKIKRKSNNKHKICAEVAWVEQRQTHLREFWVFKHFKTIKTFVVDIIILNV